MADCAVEVLSMGLRASYTNICSNSPLQQQYPGIQGLPAAPTPPPAAPSSVASYPSYQGGYQGGYPQSGFSQVGYQQSNFPQRPPPLGQGEVPPSQQSMPPSVRTSGYVQVSRNYSNQPPPPSNYNVGWQYSDQSAQQKARSNAEAANRVAMVPSTRNFSSDIAESKLKHMSERYHYQEFGQPSSAEVHHPQIEEQTVPVLLCHTCSVCGQMRSAGYHRHNPVVPGRPLVLTPCRRCKKKTKSQHHTMNKYTRIRSCTAEEPCDWPRESVRIGVDHHEHRGRRRSREEVRVYRHSPSRPRGIRQSSSQTRLGLCAFQQDQSMSRGPRDGMMMRVSPLSPRRASRYDGIWPPPDVVSTRPVKPADRPATRINPNLTSRDEVRPPPDVRTHSYRKAAASPPRRQSSRIIELSPSPPPPHTHSTRVVYRSNTVEPRPRSVSPVRVSFCDERRSEDAEARMMSHPRPYRPVVPDQRNFQRTSEEIASSSDYTSRGRQNSPCRSILKSAGEERETSRRRTSMRESQQSTTVEIGGPKVHFSSERRNGRPNPSKQDMAHHSEHARRSDDEYQVCHNYSRHRYVDDPSPPPPVEEMERLRMRRSSPSPPRRCEEVRVRHVSPFPARERERTPRPPPASLSPERAAYSGYRHISRTRTLSRTRSLTPPPIQKPADEDVTDSDSAHSGEITEVRSWRGIDEIGQPATFVEERKTVRMLEQGSELGGQTEFRKLREGLAARSWRDV
jgi:hypothetical protein